MCGKDKDFIDKYIKFEYVNKSGYYVVGFILALEMTRRFASTLLLWGIFIIK